MNDGRVDELNGHYDILVSVLLEALVSYALDHRILSMLLGFPT
jgi:hypothetical protein